MGIDFGCRREIIFMGKRYQYFDRIELLDETPSLEITFGAQWKKAWIVFVCTCGRKISKPITSRQLVVKCDECDSVVRQKKENWYRSI
jgi:hypothetical protein